MKRFGEKLRYIRKQNKLTLSQLASNLNLSAHGYISEVERGRKKPSVDFVLKVSRFFNVSTDQLLKDELDIVRVDSGNFGLDGESDGNTLHKATSNSN